MPKCMVSVSSGARLSLNGVECDMAGCEGARHKALGEWVSKQRVLKRKGSKRMTPARIEELNRIPGWLWDVMKKE